LPDDVSDSDNEMSDQELDELEARINPDDSTNSPRFNQEPLLDEQ